MLVVRRRIWPAPQEAPVTLAFELFDSGQADKIWVERCAYREVEELIKVPIRRRLISPKSKTGNKYAD